MADNLKHIYGSITYLREFALCPLFLHFVYDLCN